VKARHIIVVAAGAALLVLTGCATAPSPTTQPAAQPQPPTESTASTAPSGAVSVEQPVAPETNPPGDIPDNQAFVPFKTPGGITVKVPEGWSRQDGPSNVLFTDKLNTIIVAWAPTTSAPTVAAYESIDVPKLKKLQPAFEDQGAKEVTLPIGPALHALYRINSAANPVTGKQYRLAVEQYSVFRSGTRVDLTLLSPVGADNVDPWRTVSESLTWR
jgi:hypothetical protein